MAWQTGAGLADQHITVYAGALHLAQQVLVQTGEASDAVVA